MKNKNDNGWLQDHLIFVLENLTYMQPCWTTSTDVLENLD